MEDFTIILRELIQKEIGLLDIKVPESAKLEFEKTAENFFGKEMFLESIKVFAITKNEKRLNEIGNFCLDKNRLEYAFKAFYFTKNREGLDKTGMKFIKQADIKNAYSCFKLSENQEMISFIETNF